MSSYACLSNSVLYVRAIKACATSLGERKPECWWRGSLPMYTSTAIMCRQGKEWRMNVAHLSQSTVMSLATPNTTAECSRPMPTVTLCDMVKSSTALPNEATPPRCLTTYVVAELRVARVQHNGVYKGVLCV